MRQNAALWCHPTLPAGLTLEPAVGVAPAAAGAGAAPAGGPGLDADPDDDVRGELAAAAFGEINEVPYRPAAETVPEWRAVSPPAVAAALRAATATAVLVLPETATLQTALGGVERRCFPG